VFLFPFVLFRKNLFEPMRLSVRDRLIRECWLVRNDELLTLWPHVLDVANCPQVPPIPTSLLTGVLKINDLLGSFCNFALILLCSLLWAVRQKSRE
jgi:hypothetical protein